MNSFLIIFSALLSNSAHADYVGQFAKYETTSHAKGSTTETKLGTAEEKILGLDAGGSAYSVQVSTQIGATAPKIKLSSFSTAELDGQKAAILLNHCAENYGTPAEAVVVKGVSYKTCKIRGGNVDFYVGAVPFTILKSVSLQKNGTVITTTLVDVSTF